MRRLWQAPTRASKLCFELSLRWTLLLVPRTGTDQRPNQPPTSPSKPIDPHYHRQRLIVLGHTAIGNNGGLDITFAACSAVTLRNIESRHDRTGRTNSPSPLTTHTVLCGHSLEARRACDDQNDCYLDLADVRNRLLICQSVHPRGFVISASLT